METVPLFPGRPCDESPIKKPDDKILETPSDLARWPVPACHELLDAIVSPNNYRAIKEQGSDYKQWLDETSFMIRI